MPTERCLFTEECAVNAIDYLNANAILPPFGFNEHPHLSAIRLNVSHREDIGGCLSASPNKANIFVAPACKELGD
jgi:hypothetical protein